MRFSPKELVLVSNGEGGFVVREVVDYCFEKHGYVLLNCGWYTTEYKTSDIHKCPPSIKRLYKERNK